MKTAEEYQFTLEQIENIKKVAFAAGEAKGRVEGMTEAIQVCKNQVAGIITPSQIGPLHASGIVTGIECCEQAIKDARDAKKEHVGMEIETLSKMHYEINKELCRAINAIGGCRGLLCILGSWGDTLPESEILAMLKDYNAVNAQPQHQSRPRMFEDKKE